MTEDELRVLGDEFRDLVFARTGLKGSDLVCPREKSEMTPCVARDGGMCVVEDTHKIAICVGCETSIPKQIEKEKQLLEKGT